MTPIIDELTHHLTQATATAFSAASIGHFLPAEVMHATQPEFGHYQCNTPLRLAKALGRPPREIAEAIVAVLQEQVDCFAQVEVAGPGFINLTLSNAFLEAQINDLAEDANAGVPLPTERQRIIVEFSSPNVAKELHVGHLRSTIIGESLARILEFLGHDVVRLNHVGDWGTQFGMLIAHMKEVANGVLRGEHRASLSDLMGWYRRSKERFDADEAFRSIAHAQVVDLQAGEPEAKKAWECICAVSREAFEEIYQMLDVQLTERGESFYNPMLAPLVEALLEQGDAVLSQGAVCIFLDGFLGKDGHPLPMIIRKSDGGYNYSTTDLAALKHRIEKEKAERIVYVTDAGQKLHFQMLLAAAEKIGYYDPNKTRVDHVTFGVVLGPDGKKFKTRSGETERLIDLLNGAIAHADRLLQDREVPENERQEMAEILGIDAVKYADLSCHRNKDYVFSYERMLKFEGNTAVFLLYAYVRIQGIKRRVRREAASRVCITHPSEAKLALSLRRFPEVLHMVDRDLLPHRLCEYLYDLAETFHAFFRDCRVQGSEYEASRLLLCELTARILQQGMHLLGLKTLNKM